MKKLNVVQIGTGHDHAADTIRTARGLTEVYNVLGFCEPDEELLEKARSHPDYQGLPEMTVDEILSRDDVDAVFIETVEAKLVSTAMIFAEAGIPIHMDKPGGETYGEFETLVRLLESKNLAFQMGYMYRYNKAVQEAYKDFKDGKLGDIISVEAHMSCRHSDEKRDWLNTLNGGMMYFLGCHMVDLVYMFCGPCDEVIPYNCKTMTEGVDALDYGFTLFKYKNGVSFVKTSAAEVNGFARRQLVITGTKGTYVICPIEKYVNSTQLISSVTTAFTSPSINDYFILDIGKNHDTEPATRYNAMMEDFAMIVNGEKENPFNYDYELEVQKMFLKACGLYNE